MSERQQRTTRQRRKKAMPQQLAFDFAEGQRRQAAGAQMAIDAALPWALQAERWLTSREDAFTSEHVVAAIGLPRGVVGVNQNNAVGALIRAWSRRGAIRRVGYTASTRVESHGALLSLWKRVASA